MPLRTLSIYFLSLACQNIGKKEIGIVFGSFIMAETLSLIKYMCAVWSVRIPALYVFVFMGWALMIPVHLDDLIDLYLNGMEIPQNTTVLFMNERISFTYGWELCMCVYVCDWQNARNANNNTDEIIKIHREKFRLNKRILSIYLIHKKQIK